VGGGLGCLGGYQCVAGRSARPRSDPVKRRIRAAASRVMAYTNHLPYGRELVPLDEALRAAETAWNAASTVAQRIASTQPHLGGSSRASDQLEELRARTVRAVRESNAYAIEFPRCHD